MVKLQIDLSDGEDRVVEIYKARNRILTKEETVKKMIASFTECKHDFEELERKEYKREFSFKTKTKGRYIKIIERCQKCGIGRTDDIKLTDN